MKGSFKRRNRSTAAPRPASAETLENGTTDELQADYETAGFGGRLPFGQRPALLLVDIVMAYLDPKSHLYAGADGVLAANIRLARAFHATGEMVVFTRVTYQVGGLDGGLFFCKVPALRAFLPGSPLGAFHESLRPTAEDIVVDKQYPSAFFGTSLPSTLHASGIDTVLIGGFSTSDIVTLTGDVQQNVERSGAGAFIPYCRRTSPVSTS